MVVERSNDEGATVDVMSSDHVRDTDRDFSHKRVESQSRRWPSISRIFIMNPIDIPDTLKLVDHPTARNTVLATRNLPIGSVVLSEPVLTSVLFPDKIGRRCDYCHRSDQAEPGLRICKCTGCGLQWYCGQDCMSDPPSSMCN